MKYMFWLTDLVEFFEFDAAKMDVKIRHHLWGENQDGDWTEKGTVYELRKCNESDFGNT